MSQALTRPGNNRDIRGVLEKMAPQFAMALPKLLTAERFVRVALTSINRSPKLLACTQESLLACLLDCAQLGIEPDGRRAHLIPFADRKTNTLRCTLIIDYKGLAELIRRSGEISALKAGIVYPGDEFDYQFGTGQYLKHKPNLGNRGNDKPYAVYSYVKLKDGEEDFDVMGIAEVERIRARSRSKDDGPWVTDFDEMAKKTVFRRHSKWLPLSPELRDKIEKDEEPLTEQERFAAAKPVHPVNFGAPDIDLPSTESGSTGNDFSETEMEENQSQPSQKSEKTVSAEPKPAKKPKKEPPARATPMEALLALIKASPISEEQLTRHLIQKMIIEPSQKLEDLTEPQQKALINQFMEICGEILEPEKPASDTDQNNAPY